jgi:hypothetical protein
MSEKLKPSEILLNPSNLKCTCPDTECEWHGNCRDCVSLHRYHATVPNCLEIAIDKARHEQSLMLQCVKH